MIERKNIEHLLSEKQFSYIETIQADVLKKANMTEDEAWDFGFRCLQCGYRKGIDMTGLDYGEPKEQPGDFLYVVFWICKGEAIPCEELCEWNAEKRCFQSEQYEFSVEEAYLWQKIAKHVEVQ